ncbi:hypothetical protein IV37_GL000605 [Fructilactobacillus fructivorans]|nr:hypothetical protein IV37_GL000605 [Fructilactobacillus fructivorans]
MNKYIYHKMEAFLMNNDNEKFCVKCGKKSPKRQSSASTVVRNNPLPHPPVVILSK